MKRTLKVILAFLTGWLWKKQASKEQAVAIDHPFVCALKAHDPEKALALLHAEPDLAMDGLDVKKGFIIAAMHDYDSVVKALLARGADINAQNQGGMTALMVCSTCGRPKALAFLLANGANVNAKNQQLHSMTAIMWAAYSRIEDRESILENITLLMKAGADPSLKNDKGTNSLRYAKWRENLDAFDLMQKLSLEAHEKKIG